MKPDPKQVKVLAKIPHRWLSDEWDERVCLVHGRVRADGMVTVTRFTQVENTHSDSANHFRCSVPKDDDSVIGILHSHLKSAKMFPGPSKGDRRKMPWWFIGGVYFDGKIRWFTSSQEDPSTLRRRR